MTAMPCCFTTNPNAHAARPRPRSNGLGVAGFVTSLVGLLTCGVLSPFGLMLSVPALVRGPRGFAMAGTVLGLIGTLWIAGIAAVTAVGAKAAVEGVERVQLVMTATQEQSHLAEKIDAFIAQNAAHPLRSPPCRAWMSWPSPTPGARRTATSPGSRAPSSPCGATAPTASAERATT